MSKADNAATTSVQLSPTPGFCVKTTTLEPGYLPPASTPELGSTTKAAKTSGTADSKSHGGLLEPSSSFEPIPVPVGMKVFVNMAYDANVPPPPQGSEDVIKRAIKGEEPPEGEESYYVPVIVSHPREDKDKSGNPSLVVDCVFNSTLKSQVLIDQDFKIFLVELALQRIEAQTGLTLSRKIGRPNITAKGKLEPRVVRIPNVLIQGAKSLDDAPKAAIIEPKPDATKEVKSILKKSGMKEKTSAAQAKKPVVEVISSTEVRADENQDSEDTKQDEWYENSWDWERIGDKLEVRIKIFRLPTANLRKALTTLDIEPRRLILTLSPMQTIDLNRMKADADIVSDLHKEAPVRAKHIAKLRSTSTPYLGSGTKFDKVVYEKLLTEVEKEELAKTDKEVSRMLLLKRERPFDVDGCRAEWRVGEGGEGGELVVTC